MNSTTWSVTLAAATGQADSPILIRGELYAVGLSYDSADAGTDVTLTMLGTTGIPNQTLLTRSNSATDGWIYPRASGVTTSASAITDSDPCLAIYGYVRLGIADSTSGKTITVTLLYED